MCESLLRWHAQWPIKVGETLQAVVQVVPRYIYSFSHVKILIFAQFLKILVNCATSAAPYPLTAAEPLPWLTN